MISSTHSGLKLSWEQLLSADEIISWATSRRQPRKFWRVGNVSHPAVYRFVFPKETDKNQSHISCYVGQAKHLSERLHEHICSREKEQVKGLGSIVHGKIQNTITLLTKDWFLQTLKIEGSTNLSGVILNEHSFTDLFARRLLENWAIAHSAQAGYHVLNRPLLHGDSDFRRKAKAASKGITVKNATQK